MAGKAQAINPSLEREIVGGLGLGALNISGTVLLILGAVIATAGSSFFGNFLAALGTIALAVSILLSMKSRHGSGFRAANIVAKAVLLLILLLIALMANVGD